MRDPEVDNRYYISKISNKGIPTVAKELKLRVTQQINHKISPSILLSHHKLHRHRCNINVYYKYIDI